MILGLVVSIAGVLWLSTRPGLSTRARMMRSRNASSGYENSAVPDESGTNKPQPTNTTNNTPRAKNHQPETPDATALERPQKPRTETLHVVRTGETLSGISEKYYGSANRWQNILQANRSSVTDPRKLQPGTKLVIPD
jgi:nucleoid-associated protein YgaU